MWLLDSEPRTSERGASVLTSELSLQSSDAFLKDLPHFICMNVCLQVCMYVSIDQESQKKVSYPLEQESDRCGCVPQRKCWEENPKSTSRATVALKLCNSSPHPNTFCVLFVCFYFPLASQTNQI